jgi:hypothetical protein
MANPDLPGGRLTQKEATARVPPPELVDMPASFDMDLFPSEQPAAAPAQPPVVDAPAQEPANDHDHAAVIDFTSRASVAPAPVLDPPSTEPGDALTLLQLLESDQHASWREAVAIVQQLCVKLKDVPSHAPVLIEPGAIQITSSGHLNLLSSQQGGDPLVIQLGRLLRSLVGTETIPSELRLLISQATFELAIFDSVEHFRKALDALLGPPDTTEVKTAFRKAAHQPPERRDPSPIEAFVAAPAPRQAQPSLLPQPTPKRKLKPSRERRFDTSGLLPRIAAAVVVIAAAVGVYVMSRELRIPSPQQAPPQYVAPAAPEAQTSGAPVSTPTTGRRDAAPKATAKTSPPDVASRLTTRAAERAPRIVTRANGPAGSSGADDSDRASTVATPAPTPPSTNESPVELIRRASALFSEGKSADAGIVLDLLVMTAPLYQPGPNELTAVGFDALRASQRQLLPSIAARELDRATAALNSGDLDRAVTLSASVSALLDRFDPDSAYPLRSKLQQLLRRTEATRNAIENAVYGATDGDVTPPQPLSRQFPEGVPTGIPAARIGTLELIVGKKGDVEFVKLHTPMNRYHERMIVSAVKAWRYTPALRGGKPVRFKLTISVNLPEAGNGVSQ